MSSDNMYAYLEKFTEFLANRNSELALSAEEFITEFRKIEQESKAKENEADDANEEAELMSYEEDANDTPDDTHLEVDEFLKDAALKSLPEVQSHTVPESQSQTVPVETATSLPDIQIPVEPVVATASTVPREGATFIPGPAVSKKTVTFAPNVARASVTSSPTVSVTFTPDSEPPIKTEKVQRLQTSYEREDEEARDLGSGYSTGWKRYESGSSKHYSSYKNRKSNYNAGYQHDDRETNRRYESYSSRDAPYRSRDHDEALQESISYYEKRQQVAMNFYRRFKNVMFCRYFGCKRYRDVDYQKREIYDYCGVDCQLKDITEKNSQRTRF